MDTFGDLSAFSLQRNDLSGAVVGGTVTSSPRTQAGVARMRLHDIDAQRCAALVETLRAQYSRLACESGAADPAEFDLAINATPLGMRPGDALPFDVARLTPSTAVADVTTKPEITPLLAAARERGCPIATGRDMFEAQTALAEQLFGWSR